MIETVIARWHRFVRGELEEGLDALIADECVFYSPIVFTPQEGKAATILYLCAACMAFGGEVTDWARGVGRVGPEFRYLREVMAGRSAVLEFECVVDGKTVNGVDMIECDEAGRIVSFKVMVRPLQAVNALHAKMGELLQAMKPPAR